MADEEKKPTPFIGNIEGEYVYQDSKRIVRQNVSKETGDLIISLERIDAKSKRWIAFIGFCATVPSTIVSLVLALGNIQ
jgi:hypothetical protein